MHGLTDRDHRSLAFVAPGALRAVLQELLRAGYAGVLTMEIFSEEDFLSSLQALQAAHDA
jgi:sugar phosphate isomerase/epimerase